MYTERSPTVSHGYSWSVPYLLGFAGCLTLAGCAPQRIETSNLVTDHETIELDESELTRVEIRMGSGELRVEGGAQNMMDADFTYNVPAWKPEVEYRSTGTRSDILISQPRTVGVPFGDYDYDWNIALSNQVRLDVIARMGAGDAQLDLGSLHLRNVDLSLGVGEIELNLEGNPTESYDVQIEGGVGQATIYLPDDVAISATAQGGIGDIEVEGLTERNGRYINPGHESDPVMIRLDVRGGVGEIRLVAR